jgi:putative membrane protein
MRLQVRDHVPAVTAILTVVSLALVFGAALQVFPTAAIPRLSERGFDLIPHVNAVVSTAAIGTILAGVREIRRGNVDRHRALMLASLALFAVFLVLYLYKVTVQGPADFPGPATVYQFVYLPVLAVHILLAIACIPLLYYVALLGLTRSVPEIYESSHRRFGRAAASLWLVSFVLGNVVYAMIYVVY